MELNNVLLKNPLELLHGQNKNLPAHAICIMVYLTFRKIHIMSGLVNNLVHQVQQQLSVMLMEKLLETQSSCSLLKTFLYRSIITVAFQGKCFAST